MVNNKWVRYALWFAGCLAIAFSLVVGARAAKTKNVKMAAKQVLHVGPPAIPVELRARWWRANAELIAADGVFQSKRAAFQNANAEVMKICGDYQLGGDQSGEPACQEKK